MKKVVVVNTFGSFDKVAFVVHTIYSRTILLIPPSSISLQFIVKLTRNQFEIQMNQISLLSFQKFRKKIIL